MKTAVITRIAVSDEKEKLVGLKELIKEKILIFDGAMGTMLQKKGLKIGENPEILNIKSPDIIEEIHREYIESGANVITTNTFGANERKLKLCNLEVEEAVDAAINIAKKARGEKEVYIALDIGPIGELLEPMGTLSFDEAYDIFTDYEDIKEERKLQNTLVEIKQKYGKNAILKGMNLCDAATTMKRNKLVGGHNAE